MVGLCILVLIEEHFTTDKHFTCYGIGIGMSGIGWHFRGKCNPWGSECCLSSIKVLNLCIFVYYF